MLFGTGGMCVCSGLVVLFTLLTKTGHSIFMWLNLAAVFGIMGSFSVAPGPVPWLITAELFTQGPRAAAMSLAGATNWIMTFVVGLVFEIILVSHFILQTQCKTILKSFSYNLLTSMALRLTEARIKFFITIDQRSTFSEIAQNLTFVSVDYMARCNHIHVIIFIAKSYYTYSTHFFVL